MLKIIFIMSLLATSLTESSIPTIYIAGDSTVTTYLEDQYFGSWGQYLNLFLDSNKVKVVDCAESGRSARSFINEGRLFEMEGNTNTFQWNDGKPIMSTIKKGDYLFVQFAHNDDEAKGYANYADRTELLGEPDENGIYPVIPGKKVSTTILPDEYIAEATEAEQKAKLAVLKTYGKEYYTFAGTYKWFLKLYIDLARSKGAIPVLVTPVSRVRFDSKGKIKYDGNFGNTHAVAIRQLAEEENCLLIENFLSTVELLETATPTYANYIMSIQPSSLRGNWPSGFDSTINNEAAGFTGNDGTHYNKFGGFLTAGKVIENILELDGEVHKDGEKIGFIDAVKSKPSKVIVPSTLIPGSILVDLYALFTKVDLSP